jgi:hypothetical protein
VWAAFDACALLARGLLMYFGPCGGMGTWFEAGAGLGPWRPAVHGIVSDWAMDLVSIEFAKPEVGAEPRTIWTAQQCISMGCRRAPVIAQMRGGPSK